MATAGALLLGTAPAAGSLPVQATATTPAASPAPAGNQAQTAPPVFAMVAGTSPLRDPSAGSGLDGGLWTPGYQPEVTSDIGPDGSPGDGEGIPSTRGAAHVATGPAGLLPGGLVLAAPVESTRITSGFGWRLNPTGPGSYIHIGQDYGVACGTPVRAAADGRVVQSAWAGHSGQRVRVDHGSGVETAYSHNSLLVARTGDRVQRGDLLALSGTTGNSTGCHVHFEVYLNGKWVDPATYLPLVPGQKRPVSEQEWSKIARSRISPAPSPSPDRSTTPASPMIAPVPSHEAGPSSAAAASKTPTAAGPSMKATESTAEPQPTKSTSPAPTDQPPADNPAAAGSETKQPATKDPQPSQPGRETPAKPPSAPATRPSSPPSSTPAASTPSAPTSAAPSTPASPTAAPSTPAAKPTTPSAPASPTSSEKPPPKPTPSDPASPSPTPGEPTTSPDPGAIDAPSLAGLCLAYELENQQEEQARKEDPKSPGSRQLGEPEIAFLTDALFARPSGPQRPSVDELTKHPTVHVVVLACSTWFPQGINEKTEPADITALVKAAAVKTANTKDTEATGK